MNHSLKILALFMSAAFILAGPVAATEKRGEKASDPKAVLRMLIEGNKRFVSGSARHPNQTTCRRGSIAQKQKPKAILVCCSDSRVPPEILFDCGLGDIFVVRTAGEVVTDVELGSIEYGAEHLGASLIMVLGHERCGAVAAAVKGGKAPGHIGSIIKEIDPAVVEAKRSGAKDILDRTMRINARNVAKKIGESELIEELVAKGKAKIVVASYDLDSGLVEVHKR